MKLGAVLVITTALLCASPLSRVVAADVALTVTQPAVIIHGRDCATAMEEWENYQVCGFGAVAVNAAGTRILAVGEGASARLFDADGHELGASSEGNGGFVESETRAFFSGDAAFALAGNTLMAFDANTGALRYRRVIPSTTYGMAYLGHDGAELLFTTDRAGSAVTDLHTGEVLHRTDAGGLYFSGAYPRWTVGMSRHHDADGDHLALVRADRDLTEQPLDHWCEILLSAKHWCVSFNPNTRQGSLFDAETRTWTAFDLSHLLDASQAAWPSWYWLQVGDDLICVYRTGIRQDIPNVSAPIPEFDVINVTTGKLLTHIEGQFQITDATDGSGAPELRIGFTPEEYHTPVTIERVSLDGHVSEITHAPPRIVDFALTPPFGDLLVASPSNPHATLVLDARGHTLAALQFDTLVCSQFQIRLGAKYCSASSDHRVVAVLGDRDVKVFRLQPTGQPGP